MEAFLNRLMKAGFGIMGAGVLATRFFFTVDGGERALKFDQLRGLQSKVYAEGMHFYIPVLQVGKIILNFFFQGPKKIRDSHPSQAHPLYYRYPRHADSGALSAYPVPPKRGPVERDFGQYWSRLRRPCDPVHRE